MGERRRPRAAVLLVAFFGLFVFLSVVGFLVGWRSEVASVEGAGIDGVLTYILICSGCIMVAGHVVLCAFVWKYSTGARSGYRRPSSRTQWLWGVVPVLVMIALSEIGVLAVAGPVWDSLYVEEPEDPLVLEVVGRQFEWFIRYPGKDGKYGDIDLDDFDKQVNFLALDEEDPKAQDDIVKRATLYLPRGRPVVLRLRSWDVLHSFFVPDFRVKQDLIPGFPTRLKFTPNRTGTFELACAELCGLGHYKMRGTVHVLEPDEFEEWLAKAPTFGGE